MLWLGPPSSAPFAEFENVKKSVVVELISSSGLFFIIFFCWPYGLSIKNDIYSWKLPKKFAEIGWNPKNKQKTFVFLFLYCPQAECHEKPRLIRWGFCQSWSLKRNESIIFAYTRLRGDFPIDVKLFSLSCVYALWKWIFTSKFFHNWLNYRYFSLIRACIFSWNHL